jgi:hypothetical protein
MPHFFVPWEHKVIYLLPLLITPSPLFLGLYLTPCISFPVFTLSPLSWPYSLNLYFTLFLFYPLIFTLSPLSWPYSLNPLFHFISILPPYLYLIPFVLTLLLRHLLHFIFILPPYLYHTPCISLTPWPTYLYPLFFKSLLFDWPSGPITNPLSLTVFEWKVVILLRHA